jgi:general secretion pathway protein K
MKPRERGVAVVLAMGVVALATFAVAGMMAAQSTWSRQLERGTEHAQSQALVRAGIDWARAVLSDDRRVSNVDYLGEPWALRLPAIPVDNGSLAGHIDDEQGKLNLNDIVTGGKVNVSELAHFKRLLSILNLPGALADSLADWISAENATPSPNGAEDAYYLALQPPYFAAHRPLIDPGELTLVRGFDDGVRAQLRPYVTALPRFTPVNVNTAPPEVLAAIVDGLSIDDARALVAQRERIYFRTVQDFQSALPSGVTAPAEDLAVSSNFFRATMRVKIGDAQARGTALLERDSIAWPTIVWRKYL